MESFKQIMPLNPSGSEVCGYISTMNNEFYIDLKVDNVDNPKEIHLKGCKKLQQVLKPVLGNLEQHLLHCCDIHHMLCEIQNMLEKQICAKVACQPSQKLDFNILFSQIQSCSWENVNYISPDFKSIHLKAIDVYDREHIIRFTIPDKFPVEAPKIECDLPQEFNYKWMPGDSLSKIFVSFQEKLCSYADFWNNMDELDGKTWILEPEKPKRQDTRRRIALASGISVMCIVNPVMPTDIPTCHYLGPERLVEPIREKFNKNIHLWSEYDTIFSNLQQVLEMEFPSPTSTTKEEFCLECGICYSYLLEETVPELTCDNQSCNQAFHHACLYEFIRTLPDVRTSFNKLFGPCPYCNMPLWCSIP